MAFLYDQVNKNNLWYLPYTSTYGALSSPQRFFAKQFLPDFPAITRFQTQYLFWTSIVKWKNIRVWAAGADSRVTFFFLGCFTSARI
jgi:hypothetical protein